MKFKIFISYCALLFLVFSSLGCEAFVRKFRRKPKKEEMPKEEMVLVPEEYPSLFASKEEEYRQYFLFWKSWQDEFIIALLDSRSHKKQLSCLDEALKNIIIAKGLLLQEKQKKLDVYIKQLSDLRTTLAEDLYTTRSSYYRSKAETIKRNILLYFSYPKIKNYLR